jgi:hypothetical protein
MKSMHMQAQYYLNSRSAAETTVICLQSFTNIKPYSTSHQPERYLYFNRSTAHTAVLKDRYRKEVHTDKH